MPKTKPKSLHPDPAELPVSSSLPTFEPVIPTRGVLSVKDWAGNDVLRAKLISVLQDPVFRMAVDTIKEVYLPTAPPASITNGENAPNVLQLLALRWMHRTGFYSFIKSLEHLAVATPLPDPHLKHWVDLLPEDDD